MLKLMPIEAIFFEGLRSGKTVQIIAGELDMNNGLAFSKVRRMIEIGAVKRSGVIKKYVYSAIEQHYEIVEKRNVKVNINIPSSEGDDIIDLLVNSSASEEQIQIIKKMYNGRNRREVANLLGMTKLEFNHTVATTRCLSSIFMKSG